MQRVKLHRVNKVKLSEKNNCQGTISKTIPKVYIGINLNCHQPARRDLSEHIVIQQRPQKNS